MSERMADSLAVITGALVPGRDLGEATPGRGGLLIENEFSEAAVSSGLARDASVFFGWYERLVELHGSRLAGGLQVMPGFWGLSLSESLAHRREELEINLDVVADDDMEPLVWEPGWLPLLRSGGGTYYVENLLGPRAGEVYYVSIPEVAVVKMWTSLPDFLDTLAAAYRTGVFSRSESGYWECDADRWASLVEGMEMDAVLRRLGEALQVRRHDASRSVEATSAAAPAAFRARGLALPEDVRRVFAWRDADPSLGGWSSVLPGYDWLDSGRALEQYDACLRLNEQMATLSTPEEAALVRWDPAWLPLIADGAGDYYAVALGRPGAPIVDYDLQDPERPVVFAGVAGLFSTIAHAIEDGVIRPDAEGEMEMDDGAFWRTAAVHDDGVDRPAWE